MRHPSKWHTRRIWALAVLSLWLFAQGVTWAHFRSHVSPAQTPAGAKACGASESATATAAEEGACGVCLYHRHSCACAALPLTEVLAPAPEARQAPPAAHSGPLRQPVSPAASRAPPSA